MGITKVDQLFTSPHHLSDYLANFAADQRSRGRLARPIANGAISNSHGHEGRQDKCDSKLPSSWKCVD